MGLSWTGSLPACILATMPFRRLILLCLGAATSLSQEPRLNAANATGLLDGKTLAGWVTSGGRYDGTARWTVEKGFLVGRQGKGRSGGLIYTERPYRNFIFSVETNIDWPFDSGVFLRMVPRGGGKGAQVTLDHRPDGEIGGIYADGFLKHNPAGAFASVPVSASPNSSCYWLAMGNIQ